MTKVNDDVESLITNGVV